MGESIINTIIDKTDLVIMSCESQKQLKVAARYADQAEKAILNEFGSDMTAEEAVIYSEFKGSNMQKLAARKIMIKK